MAQVVAFPCCRLRRTAMFRRKGSDCMVV
jgi:hypothetical protein